MLGKSSRYGTKIGWREREGGGRQTGERERGGREWERETERHTHIQR